MSKLGSRETKNMCVEKENKRYDVATWTYRRKLICSSPALLLFPDLFWALLVICFNFRFWIRGWPCCNGIRSYSPLAAILKQLPANYLYQKIVTRSYYCFLRIITISKGNPKQKHYCIVWNEPPQALASMSMHTKLNICVITKQVTFPH